MSDHRETIDVQVPGGTYPIHIGDGILEGIENYLFIDITGRSVFLVTDENVYREHGQKLEALLQSKTEKLYTHIFLPGEKTKSFDHLQELLNFMLEKQAERGSVLLAMGGGVVGDISGFAASILLRGIPFVQIPTTLLSQVDSSVGGKTAINTQYGKNLVGSFYQPQAVICDVNALRTLPKRELLAGYAEALKYGLALNYDLFEWFEAHGSSSIDLDPKAIMHVIAESCREKAKIVVEDEKEHGRRALLNLGHTFGHVLELYTGYSANLLHGEAVAIGMCLAFTVSHRMGLCQEDDLQRVINHMKSVGLPTKISDISPPIQGGPADLIKEMYSDKKVSEGKLTFILVRGIGSAFVTQEVDMSIVASVLEESAS